MEDNSTQHKNIGRVVEATGPIVDVMFHFLTPPIGRALFLPEHNLYLEVVEYLRNRSVRCLALGSTDAVKRNATVIDTQQRVAVPLGPGVLGRVLDVFGRPLDGGP